jgi:hypothetical protein
MNTIRNILVSQFRAVSLILITLLEGCASPESAARGQQGKMLQSAVQHFAQLKQQDRLPGIRREEHGSLTTKALPLREGDISYPASVTIRATKKGDDSTYSYGLLKESESSPWQLVKASRLGKDGKLLEELPLK